MRATKTQTKTATKKVGTGAPNLAGATGPRKSASGQTTKITKLTSNSTVATSRVAQATAGPKTAPRIDKSALARHRMADWRADDADWTQLRADRHRPAWHLAALAFGLKPLEDLAERLQAAGRIDEKQAYGDLIRTLEINLTQVDDSNRLQYVNDDASDSARKKIDQFVDVAKFVQFVDSRNIIINERLVVQHSFCNFPEH